MASNSTLKRATPLMVALATVIVQMAMWTGQQQPWLQLGGLAIAIAISLAAGHWLNSREESRLQPLMITALVALWVMPLVAEPVLRGLLGIGRPLEILLVISLRNAMLGLSAVRNNLVCQRMACGASCFLTLFAFMLQFNWSSSIIAGFYAVVAMWWLIGGYWERLSGKMPAATDSHLPKRATLLAVGIVAVAVLSAVLVFGRGESRRVLAGIMPSSGGEGRGDRFAISGVGDGDQLISAEFDASSFGPVESEVFLESDMPSLYDMFDESYGEPPKPNTERAIAVELQERDDGNQRTATTTTSSREFSTVRQRRHKPRELKDRQAPAMLYLVGRVPAHLALETYDTFDGARWTKSGRTRFHSNLKLESIGDQPWLRTRMPTRRLFAEGYAPHMVKIINLETTRFPSPPHLARVHIDKVDRLEFYGWSNEGVLEMPNRESITQLAVVHMRSLQPLKGRLDALGDFRTLLPQQSELIRQEAENDIELDSLFRKERLGYDLAPYYQAGDRNQLADELCESWIADKPAGWPQVKAVVDGLRDSFEHDPAATAPEDCDDMVAHFLQAGRGPDYMFATTAAMMLRRQGYPTRLVGGFYADPKRFDRAAGETAVLGDDVHMWVEVCIDGVHWMPLEPTPGYEPPPESLTTMQWAMAGLWSMFTWLLAGWIPIVSGVLFVAAALAARRPLLDGAASLVWWTCSRGSAMNQLRWTVWLLEQRAALAGLRRPGSTTFSRWCANAASVLPAQAAKQVRDFASACDSAFYGRGGLSNETSELCHSAAKACRRNTFKRLAT